MSKSTSILLLGSLLLMMIVAAGTIMVLLYVPSQPAMRACTMEAKLCLDGKTYVGRTGPRCEFAACPSGSPSVSPSSSASSMPSVNTTGWKTYRNEKYGFEVKYPGDWIVEENYGPYGNIIYLESPRSDKIQEELSFEIDPTEFTTVETWSAYFFKGRLFTYTYTMVGPHRVVFAKSQKPPSSLDNFVALVGNGYVYQLPDIITNTQDYPHGYAIISSFKFTK